MIKSDTTPVANESGSFIAVCSASATCNTIQPTTA
jgi:hypothetical protein